MSVPGGTCGIFLTKYLPGNTIDENTKNLETTGVNITACLIGGSYWCGFENFLHRFLSLYNHAAGHGAEIAFRLAAHEILLK